MAQILVKIAESVNADPVIDKRGCYKYGDPVVVTDDEHKWGRSECLPSFVILKCKDVNVDDINHLLDSLTKQTSELDSDGNPTSPDVLTRKRYNFNFELLPAQYKNQLFANGSVTLPFYILETVLINKE